jgi:hypothetical protein
MSSTAERGLRSWLLFLGDIRSLVLFLYSDRSRGQLHVWSDEVDDYSCVCASLNHSIVVKAVNATTQLQRYSNVKCMILLIW